MDILTIKSYISKHKFYSWGWMYLLDTLQVIQSQNDSLQELT